jgi:hypothetical protein
MAKLGRAGVLGSRFITGGERLAADQISRNACASGFHRSA